MHLGHDTKEIGEIRVIREQNQFLRGSPSVVRDFAAPANFLQNFVDILILPAHNR
jgi:hypothetical protein